MRNTGFLGRSKAFYYDLIERVAHTFWQGFLVAWVIASGLQGHGASVVDFDLLFSLTSLKGGIVGGILALVKGGIASQLGDKNSAAITPVEPP